MTLPTDRRTLGHRYQTTNGASLMTRRIITWAAVWAVCLATALVCAWAGGAPLLGGVS